MDECPIALYGGNGKLPEGCFLFPSLHKNSVIFHLDASFFNFFAYFWTAEISAALFFCFYETTTPTAVCGVGFEGELSCGL
jgi:hypothetical protein